jgi:ATP-dependent Lon protease
MQIEDINKKMDEQSSEQVDETTSEEVNSYEQFEDDFSEEFNTEPKTPVDPVEKDSSINAKLNDYFAGKIVRKDLTKKIKEGANVPVYVLEYLLGMYCATTDEASIEQGVETVKKILADNFVRPDEAQKIISKLREHGSYTVIDKISVKLNYRNDTYEAEFSNLGIKDVPISEKYASEFERLLCGGIWCIAGLEYFFDEADKNRCPFLIKKLTPIQMPNLDLSEVLTGREQFTKDEWIDILLRSVGMESSRFSDRVKWLLLARMIPLVENNFNLCELGPRGTGKSHVYKEISPNSILVSGGQTTVANLFYNMSNKTVGLVGMWDCVAFDEVAGITFKDKDGVQIMKDYMASGSFARGKEEKNASAGMVFVGNINQSVDVLLKTSHLFDPFPEAMANDSAFFDRMHCYIPGWEVPKYRPEFFTDDYGFITDYLSEFLRELRKKSFSDSFDKYFKLGNNLNQRDVIAVRKMVSGLVKLIYPHGKFTKEEVEEILRFALESRRRVKEQLKKIGGMEFYDVNFSYIDNESFAEEFVPVPEQGGGKLIPEGLHKPGQVYTVSQGKSGMIGVFKLETEMVTGSGKFERTGIGSDREAKESLDTSFRYFKANSKNISGSISTTTKDYLMHIQDLNGIGMTNQLTLAALVALSSSAMNKPALSSLAVLGNLSIGGTVIKVQELANVLQVCLDSGAKKVLLPISSAVDMSSVPAELMGKFNLIFYQTPEDAVFKALGVD